MDGYLPTAEEQLTFLSNIQRLLSEGDFSATYKFALLCALADLSVERESRADGKLTIPIKDIAEKFISYYWPQTCPYIPTGTNAIPSILQQNSSGQAKILSLLCEYQTSQTPKLALAKGDGLSWERLISSVSSVVVTMPLWRLQTVGDIAIPLVFSTKIQVVLSRKLHFYLVSHGTSGTFTDSSPILFSQRGWYNYTVLNAISLYWGRVQTSGSFYLALSV